jgi:hypothetical protein
MVQRRYNLLAMRADGVLVQVDTRFFYTETEAIEEWMNSGEDRPRHRRNRRYWIQSATEGRLIEMISQLRWVVNTITENKPSF